MEAIGLLFVLALLAALILPWVNTVKLMHRKQELDRLRSELAELKRASVASVVEAKTEAVTEKVPEPEPAPTEPKGRLVIPAAAPPPIPKPAPRPPVLEEKPELPPLPATSTVSEDAANRDWFSKLAVWVGAVALLMAGFYMVKYSIESGWMTPLVRLWITTVFGLSLCVSGFVISLKSKFQANERIGQALSGAGVACLYFASYAAVHLHGFLGTGAGFICMLSVTVLAVLLSLKNGAPIALMALLGGFLTPWLMHTGDLESVSLLAYLFLLYSAAQFLCVRRGWWGLWLFSIVAAYAWTLFILLGHWAGGGVQPDGLMFFLLGLCLINGGWALFSEERQLSELNRAMLVLVRLLVWGGGVFQALLLAWMGGFGHVDMAFCSVLSLGALCLAVLREREYLWASWLGLLAMVSASLFNLNPATSPWMLWPLGLSLVFAAVAHFKGLRSDYPIHWRALSMLALIWPAPVLYLREASLLPAEAAWPGGSWLVMSFVSALLLALAGEHVLRRATDGKAAFGEYQSFSVFLMAFGLWAFLPEAYLPHGLAVLFGLAGVYWKLRKISRVELVLGVMGLAWSIVMLLSMMSLGVYFFRLDEPLAEVVSGATCLSWLMGAALGLAGFKTFHLHWQQLQLSRLVAWWAGLCALFALTAAFQFLDTSFLHGHLTRMTVEGLLTSVLAVLAVSFLAAKHRVHGAGPASLFLALLFLLRVVWLHLCDKGASGPSFFMNALFWQFGLPFFACFVAAWLAARNEAEKLRAFYQICAMLLGFVWCTFLVQDYFGGRYLFSFRAQSTELYAYSVVWLLLAVVYQTIGLWRAQQVIHLGSLILLLITVAKVFLVDASELEGLFRVLSFLGLGMALIGIGFFYNKVVFSVNRRATAGSGSEPE
ncbi:DUF2339 domain-containing protein [Coraliomargarita parva]|uniref:DUF2339 domain-containing protein n=1 Tax=Coraliomargarita parva TaxID=3014050 RepID=UPI0022B2DD61|nr:DUF2339 domain-containing protein [Coraliomargarita parva]